MIFRITEDVFGTKVMFIRRRLLSHFALHHIGAEPRYLRNTQNEVIPLLHFRTSYTPHQKGVPLPNEKNIQHHWSV